MSFAVCTRRPLSAALDLEWSANNAVERGELHAFRRRQKVHASGARFRTRPAAGVSLAAVLLLLPSMKTNLSTI